MCIRDRYDAVDRVIEKLSSQMSRFKSKLQKKYKGQPDLMFADLPEYEEDVYKRQDCRWTAI